MHSMGSVSAVYILPSISSPLEDVLVSYEHDDDQKFQVSVKRKVLALNGHDDDDPENVIPTLLIRPSDTSPGLFAYHNPTSKRKTPPNIRATRLAMACGLFSMRFYGTVLLIRRPLKDVTDFLTAEQIETACSGSPDLRSTILSSLGMGNWSTPRWLLQAAQSSYHDQSALEKLAAVMQNSDESDDEEEGSEDDDSLDRLIERHEGEGGLHEFVSTVPLCLHCRRPASELCTGCHGVYFCDEKCRQQG